jgi:hypothetical protein
MNTLCCDCCAIEKVVPIVEEVSEAPMDDSPDDSSDDSPKESSEKLQQRMKEDAIRSEEDAVRYDEDAVRREEDKVRYKEFIEYRRYLSYKHSMYPCDSIYYTEPSILDKQIERKIEEDDRREKENARRKIEDDRREKEDARRLKEFRKPLVQELGIHVLILEHLLLSYEDPTLKPELIEYYKERIQTERAKIKEFRYLLRS